MTIATLIFLTVVAGAAGAVGINERWKDKKEVAGLRRLADRVVDSLDDPDPVKDGAHALAQALLEQLRVERAQLLDGAPDASSLFKDLQPHANNDLLPQLDEERQLLLELEDQIAWVPVDLLSDERIERYVVNLRNDIRSNEELATALRFELDEIRSILRGRLSGPESY